jgi:acetyl esterase
MAVDNATLAFLGQVAKTPSKPRHEMTPDEAREALGRLRALFGPGPAVLAVEDISVSLPDGTELPTRLLLPQDDPTGLLVYFHGGGWVIGSRDEFEPLGRGLAVGTGCTVAMVDYRRAPEHPYPGPVEDAWEALVWCADNAELLRAAGKPLLVGGDSAGANLAIVATHRARDRGGPLINAQLLLYPVTDCDLDRPSYVDPANQLMLTRETMQWYWRHYLPEPARRTETEASPLRAGHLGGLPPAVIVTAEHDPLRDEGEAYACALADAGVPVMHRRFDGQMHAFLMMVDLLPGSDAGMDYVNNAIRQHLAALDERVPESHERSSK